MSHDIGLHWFRHDLRVSHNEALISCSERVANMIAIYVFDEKWYQTNEAGYSRISSARELFLKQNLYTLRAQLARYNIPLLCFKGNATTIITQLVADLKISTISVERHYGFDEMKAVNILIQKGGNRINLIEGNSHYLYDYRDLPFSIENMPNTFTPVRKKLEKYASLQSLPPKTPSTLPLDESFTARLQSLSMYEQQTIEELSNATSQFSNDELGALQRVNDYFFTSDRIAQYKQTRNGLDGWDFSSRLSAYLAHGCISPLKVIEQLKRYEQTRVENESTYWLFFELLWREFFHLSSLKHGARLFREFGLREVDDLPNTLRSRDMTKYRQWIEGDTPYPIVNACMNQLAQTGFMSNRGRQLVASCLIHELGLDWRLGAQYFEYMLIDYDVASNYGNWQYLAGVGADPRGLRQFNLDKQTQTYDPNKEFIRKWT